jgi:hypothetical protein
VFEPFKEQEHIDAHQGPACNAVRHSFSRD